eukprot:XP_014049544.1 PREDICTED: C-Jun-amino-terminal kinase-interacting protein 4-like isoform X3 [Salmo salar]
MIHNYMEHVELTCLFCPLQMIHNYMEHVELTCLFCPLQMIHNYMEHVELTCLFCPLQMIHNYMEHVELTCLFCPLQMIHNYMEHVELTCLFCPLQMIHNYMEHVELTCLFCPLQMIHNYTEHVELTCLFCPLQMIHNYMEHVELTCLFCPLQMIHNYMEHVERIKLHHMSVVETSDSGTVGRVRKERPMSLGVFPMSGGGSVLTPDLQARSETPGAEAWRFNDLERPRSNASLKLDADDPPKKRDGYSTLQISWGNSLPDDCKDELSDLGSKSVTPMSTTASDVAMEGERPNSLPENEDSSEVHDIIESTPELDMDLSGYKASSTPTKGGIGIENMAFDRNTDSLFAELSSAGIGDVIGDVDEGADLLVEYSGMGREVENLITENTQLMETK